MLLVLLSIAHLLQLSRVSWVIWAVALLILAAGVSMLVYFLTRFKRIEKEAEEDWSLSQRSLFVNAPPAEHQESIEDAGPAPGFTGEAAEPAEAGEPAVAYEVTEPQPEPEPAVVQQETEPAATQLLSSDRMESGAAEPDRTAPLGNDVWAELEPGGDEAAPRAEMESFGQSIPAEKGTSLLGSVPVEPEPAQPARVEERAPRAPFEPPRIEPVIKRKPFEPPRIEPILPGERLAKPLEAITPETPAAMPVSYDRDEREAVASGATVAPPAEAEPAGVSGHAARVTERKVAGTILNLPPEASSKPLVLGEPQRSKDDFGIGSLTNYGKDTGPRAGHAGTITLVAAVLLVAGSTLAYLYVPSVNSRVNEVVERIRNRGEAPPQPAVERPRARILPSLKPEVNKNMVKIRGAVYNTSDQPLEGLAVEITLRRDGDAPAETRSVPVNPSTLAPNQQGIYELEYDGKTFRSAGVTNLTDKDGQVKYTIPLQPK